MSFTPALLPSPHEPWQSCRADAPPELSRYFAPLELRKRSGKLPTNYHLRARQKQRAEFAHGEIVELDVKFLANRFEVLKGLKGRRHPLKLVDFTVVIGMCHSYMEQRQ